MDESRLIITNTSPLINFAETGCLHLLEALPGTVVIPSAVTLELQAKAGLFPKVADVFQSGRFSSLAPMDKLLARSFSATLHPGEAECLALAMENPGSLLVLDDLSARAAARANGLVFTGTLGILVQSKASGLVAELAPLLETLRNRARFWIHPQLEQSILREVGE